MPIQPPWASLGQNPPLRRPNPAQGGSALLDPQQGPTVAGPSNGQQPSPSGSPIGTFGFGAGGQAQTWGAPGTGLSAPTGSSSQGGLLGQQGQQQGSGGPQVPGMPGQPNVPLNQNGQGAGGLLGQLTGAMNQDLGNLQSAERDRANATGQAVNRYTGFLDSVQGQANQIGQNAAAPLDKLGNSLVDAGDQAARRFEQSVKPGVDAGNARAGQAVDTARGAVNQFNTDTSKFSDSMVLGIKSRYQDQIDSISRGMNTDGTPMDAKQKLAASQQLQESMGHEITQGLSGIQMNLQNTMAGLRGALAGTQLQAGEVAQRGAQISESAVAGGEQARNQYANLRTGLAETGAQLRSAAGMRGLELRAQGEPTRAEMLDRFSYSPVSLFSGMAALSAVATAPGGRTQPGLNLGSGPLNQANGPQPQRQR